MLADSYKDSWTRSNVANSWRYDSVDGGPDPDESADYPVNFLVFNGQPILFNGQPIIYTGAPV